MGGKKIAANGPSSSGERSIWDNKHNKFGLSHGDKTPGSNKPAYGGSAEGSFKIKRGKQNGLSSSFKGRSTTGNGALVTNIKISRGFNGQRKVSPNDELRNSNTMSNFTA